MGFFEFFENLGAAPLPEESAKTDNKDLKEKQNGENTSNDAPIEDNNDNAPEDDNPKDDKPNDNSDKSDESKVDQADVEENKPRKMTVDEVIKVLEKKGFTVTRNDEAQPAREPAPASPAAPLPSPAPAPAPQYFEAHDTTPKVYQNPHLGVRLVQDGDFYTGLANGAYNFDRMFGHGQTALDPAIISWIGSLYPDVPELAEDIVKNRLRDILRKNPTLIQEVKKIARETTVETIPFAATFVSKLDNTTEYESENDAEAALAPYKAIGATMQSTYAIRYRKRHFDGTLGEIVDPNVVLDFARNYDGDLDKLCHDLWLSRSKVKNSDTSTAGDATPSN